MISGLDTVISGDGSNFSIGQRQLICLAKVIVRQNRILILDEATANVDMKTDQLIQTTIRDAFDECTVLTIAHHPDTIIDSDRILVLDAGRVAEFGPPTTLLDTSVGIFHSMVAATGVGQSARVKSVIVL